jgi:hypothetical protein
MAPQHDGDGVELALVRCRSTIGEGKVRGKGGGLGLR